VLAALGGDVDAVAKDLELYAGDEPPAGWSLEAEVAGVVREADARGFDRFHLVGFSGGGAASLVFAASPHAERLLSLALIEPAWAGNERTPREAELHRQFDVVQTLPPKEQLAEFTRLQVAPGVVVPPRTDPPPPWMAKRPAGIRAFLRTFEDHELDLDALGRFTRPVYFALGGLSHPDYFAEIATRLAKVFPDFTVETFEERHHFDPPQRREAERLAASLLAHWRRAEAA
jgi:pimeloyl-ACP methyl ester carboxylesterase